MTTKAIMSVVAATFGLVASADVIEVKFTVKTEDEGKVVSKTISGYYDTDTDKNVFWSVQKVNGKNAKVAYENTYFGLANYTEAAKAKKFGQNAELIWGDDNENVLVAGAWGKAASKSGQVAGMLDGVPATGTWSAKVKTKKTYAQLLAAAGLSQAENRENSVIDGAVADAKKAVADAEAAAAQKIADAEAEAAQKVADAKSQGEEAVKKAEAEADALVAKAKEDAQKSVDQAKEDAEDKINEIKVAMEAKNAELDAANEALTNAVVEAQTLVDAFKDINDPDVPNMFSDYLKKASKEAQTLKDEAIVITNEIEEAYAAYVVALDLGALSNNVLTAKSVLTDATDDYNAKKAAYDALVTTNAMIVTIKDGGVDAAYSERLGAAKKSVSSAEGALETAKTSGYTEYVDKLEKTDIPAQEREVTNASDAWTAAITDLATKTTEYVAATNALASFVEPTYKSFDDYIAEQEAASGTPYATEIAKQEAYKAYKDQAYHDAYDPVYDKAQSATIAYGEAITAESQKAQLYTAATNELTKLTNKLATAKESGEIPNLSEFVTDLTTASNNLAKVEAEIAFWKNYSVSENEKAALLEAESVAETAKNEADGVKSEAESAVTAAEAAYNNQADTASAALAVLSEKIGSEKLTDIEEKALPIETIRQKVDAYEEKYLGYIKSADTSLNAIASICEQLNIEL